MIVCCCIRGGFMRKKKGNPMQFRRAGGLAMIATGFGMLFTWAFPGLSLVLAFIFLGFGFWLLFL